MKLTLKIMTLVMAVCLVSCSDKDKAIYDGDANSNQTLIQIENQSYDLRVDENGEGSIEINALSSTKFKQDRTFKIEYVSDDIEDNAVEYDFDNSVTIPANKYIGSFEVHVTQSNLINKNYTLKLELTAPDSDNSDVVLEHNMTTINFLPNENE